MYSVSNNEVWPPLGCPIRKSSGRSLCAAHRSLSQLVASFIAWICQVIHYKPLKTWSRKTLDYSTYCYPILHNCQRTFEPIGSKSIFEILLSLWSWRGLLRQILTCLASQNLCTLLLLRSSNVKTFERSRVELKRIELLTPCLQSRCSPSWATAPYNCVM